MTRRAIERDEEASIRERVARALGKTVDGVRATELIGARGFSAGEKANLARIGIHPGADGWEIEDEPAALVTDVPQGAGMGEQARIAAGITRPPLPPGVGWYEHGHESYGLDRRRPAGEETIATVRFIGLDWRWRVGEGEEHGVRGLGGLPAAKALAEDACRAAGLLEAVPVRALPFDSREWPEPAPGFRWRLRGRSGYCLIGPVGSLGIVACIEEDVAGKCWRWSFGAAAREGVDGWASEVRLDLAKTYAEDNARSAGLFIVAKVAALHDAAGAPPTGAARALYRLLCADAGEDEHGHHSDEVIGSTCAMRAARRARLCESFVAELRASLPAPPMPSPRTADGALTAYLLEHHREAWRPGDDALSLAIRLLGESRDKVLAAGNRALQLEVELEAASDAAHDADESAKELEKVLRGVRFDLEVARRHLEGAKRHEAEIEAEALIVARERDEARADLARVRDDVLATARDLAAKLGAPHG